MAARLGPTLDLSVTRGTPEVGKSQGNNKGLQILLEEIRIFSILLTLFTAAVTVFKGSFSWKKASLLIIGGKGSRSSGVSNLTALLRNQAGEGCKAARRIRRGEEHVQPIA